MKDEDEDGADEGSLSSFILPPSSFDAHHLFDLSDDFNQVFLILHHRFDRFVSAGNFIQHAYVFTTFNARSLTSEVVFGEGSLRRATRHLAASTVRAGIETLRCTASFDDERFRAHRSRND